MADTPPDILIHAGFHKTGTSSLQAFLELNRGLLEDHFLFYGKDDFLNAGAAARRYGQRPFPWRLRVFRKRFRTFLATLPDGHRIVLSRETFCGIMPGHRRLFGPVRSYSTAAGPLARAIIAELRQRFGPEVKIAFLYTTRDRQGWMRSVYGHLLRSIRLTKDFKGFASGLDDISLEEQTAALATALAPVPVHSAPLHRFARAPLGPAQIVLDIMQVPLERRERLTPIGPVNTGHSLGVLEEFLALNRKERDKARLKAAKEDILNRK